jgi:uncharacterized phage infection (PIP) family protein YhgE
MMSRMDRRGSAIAAVVGVLVLAGCGGEDPSPFTEVEQPATTTTTKTTKTAVVIGTPRAEVDLAGLPRRQRTALTALVGAQAGLIERGDAVAVAGADAAEIAGRVGAGYAAPSGSTPEVRRLVDALTSFGDALDAITTSSSLLPQLSAELQVRSERLMKRRPAAAARLLQAKQEVDATVAGLPALRREVDDAAAKARDQLAETTLDAEMLAQAITGGSTSAKTALNGVNSAIATGLEALTAAA